MEEEKFDWTAYNESQTKEKLLFLELLKDLTRSLERTHVHEDKKTNRINRMVFCLGVKVYSNLSSRRVISDLEICRRAGHIKEVPHFNTITNYLNSKQLTKYLKDLVRLSALPLAQLERRFAIDGSGVAERNYLQRWSEVRQKHYKHRSYKKIHAIVGVYSNVIASVIVTDGNKNDSPYFKQLLEEAAANFEIEEVSADKAYLSRDNLKAAGDLNISPFIPLKKNSVKSAKGAMMWHKMYKFFHENPEKFDKHYHLRSNVESSFFMMKRRFGDFVYSKNSTSQVNEILCKAICHNISVLVQEIFLSKIEIDFDSCANLYLAHVKN